MIQKNWLKAFVAILCTLTSISFARLGETREECVKRYGPGILKEAKQGIFTELTMPNNLTPRIRFDITLHDDVCVAIDYTSACDGSAKYFTAKEVEEIIQKNSEGHTWKKVPIIDDMEDGHWERSDGGFASWHSVSMLKIQSGKYQELLKQNNDAKKQDADKKRAKELDNL